MAGTLGCIIAAPAAAAYAVLPVGVDIMRPVWDRKGYREVTTLVIKLITKFLNYNLKTSQVMWIY